MAYAIDAVKGCRSGLGEQVQMLRLPSEHRGAGMLFAQMLQAQGVSFGDALTSYAPSAVSQSYNSNSASSRSASHDLLQVTSTMRQGTAPSFDSATASLYALATAAAESQEEQEQEQVQSPVVTAPDFLGTISIKDVRYGPESIRDLLYSTTTTGQAAAAFSASTSAPDIAVSSAVGAVSATSNGAGVPADADVDDLKNLLMSALYGVPLTGDLRETMSKPSAVIKSLGLSEDQVAYAKSHPNYLLETPLGAMTYQDLQQFVKRATAYAEDPTATRRTLLLTTLDDIYAKQAEYQTMLTEQETWENIQAQESERQAMANQLAPRADAPEADPQSEATDDMVSTTAAPVSERVRVVDGVPRNLPSEDHAFLNNIFSSSSQLALNGNNDDE